MVSGLVSSVEGLWGGAVVEPSSSKRLRRLSGGLEKQRVSTVLSWLPPCPR
jgi:hypothetical protein